MLRACPITTSDSCEWLILATRRELIFKIALAISPHNSRLSPKNDFILVSRAVIRQALRYRGRKATDTNAIAKYCQNRLD